MTEDRANRAEWLGGDGIYVEGRVPGPRGRGFVNRIYGPFTTYKAAHDAGRIRRLGGLRTFEVREGRRVV